MTDVRRSNADEFAPRASDNYVVWENCGTELCIVVHSTEIATGVLPYIRRQGSQVRTEERAARRQAEPRSGDEAALLPSNPVGRANTNKGLAICGLTLCHMYCARTVDLRWLLQEN
jgi:hypothetical protein